jgi:hypothetical protein
LPKYDRAVLRRLAELSWPANCTLQNPTAWTRRPAMRPLVFFEVTWLVRAVATYFMIS